jgi:hypothetical protein
LLSASQSTGAVAGTSAGKMIWTQMGTPLFINQRVVKGHLLERFLRIWNITKPIQIDT